jgi:hypothetical protein
MANAIETVEELRGQAQRIERILLGLLNPKPYRSSYLYSDEGISFRIDDANGRILCEAYRPTTAGEVQSMSDEWIESRLKEMFANTHRLLYSIG